MNRTPLLAACALLAAIAAASPPAATKPGGGWIVVQADGARVVLEAPPATRDGRLVGRLAGAGTLVSIPVARVDAAATERANRTGAAPAPSPVSARQTPAPFATPPLGDLAKLTRSPEEARKVLESAVKGGTVPSPAPPPEGARTAGTAEPAATAELPEPKDLKGRGEAYWRERAAAARGVLEDAESSLAAAEAELRAAERSYLGVGEAERNTFIVRVIEARDVAERARAQHRSAAGRWEALQEEARKAGAFPGWLR